MNPITPYIPRRSVVRIPQNVRPCLQCTFRMQQLASSRRHLSTSQSRSAQAGDVQMRGNLLRRVAGERSMKSRMKNVKANEIPTDIGMIPQTFVSPPLGQILAIGNKDPKRMFKILWLRIKSSATGFGSALYAYKWGGSKDRLTGEAIKKPKLELRQRTKFAQDLHEKLYTALAAGDLPVLKEISCTGLLNKGQQRLYHRKESRKPSETWKLVKYRGIVPPTWLPWIFQFFVPRKAIRVMSDRVMPLPFAKNSTLRQCVVRISSLQQLDKNDGLKPQFADLTEYVVLQRMFLEGQKDRGWMIWGTVEPATPEEIDDLLSGKFAESEMSLLDQFKMNMP